MTQRDLRGKLEIKLMRSLSSRSNMEFLKELAKPDSPDAVASDACLSCWRSMNDLTTAALNFEKPLNRKKKDSLIELALTKERWFARAQKYVNLLQPELMSEAKKRCSGCNYISPEITFYIIEQQLAEAYKGMGEK